MSRTQGIERSEIDDLMIMQTALGLLNEEAVTEGLRALRAIPRPGIL